MSAVPRPIAPELALIETCTVEIRVLSIGKKQMTLAVFRQLPETLPVPDLGWPADELPLWGRVQCPIGDAEEHVLWSDGAELHRFATVEARRALDAAAARRKAHPENQDDEAADYAWYVALLWRIDSLPQLFIAV